MKADDSGSDGDADGDGGDAVGRRKRRPTAA